MSSTAGSRAPQRTVSCACRPAPCGLAPRPFAALRDPQQPTKQPAARRLQRSRPRHSPPPPLAAAAAAGEDGLVAAGPPTPAPDYAAIDAQPLNRVVYGLFRRRMAAAIGADSPLEGCACGSMPGVIQGAAASLPDRDRDRDEPSLTPTLRSSSSPLSPSLF